MCTCVQIYQTVHLHKDYQKGTPVLSIEDSHWTGEVH